MTPEQQRAIDYWQERLQLRLEDSIDDAPSEACKRFAEDLLKRTYEFNPEIKGE